MRMHKAIVLLSGGLDSAVALWWAKRKWQVYTLTFKFGSTNSNEVRSARKLAVLAKVVRHTVVDLPFLKQMSELKRQENVERRKLPSVYIPSRNTVFFGIASYYAEIHGARYIITGHTATDPFPDSKPPYIKAMNEALSRGSWLGKDYQTRIIRPFSRSDKVSVLRLGLKLKVPLTWTWSCHENRRTPCRRCAGCMSRAKAFKKLGLTDSSRS